MEMILTLLVGLALCHMGFAQQAGSCDQIDQNNPCSPLRVAKRYHYAYQHSKFYFIQCSNFGGCWKMPCGPHTEFDYQSSTCVHSTGNPNTHAKTSTTTTAPILTYCSTKLYFWQVPIRSYWNSRQQYRVQLCGCQLLGNFYGLSLTQCQQKSCEMGGNAINYYRHNVGSYLCEVRRCQNGNLQLIDASHKYGGVYSVYSSAFNCGAHNPCTPANRQARRYYHEHDNRYKFVQCDDHGGCFAMPCAPGTAWSQSAYTCDHA